MCTDFLRTGKIITETRLVESAAERRKHLTEDNDVRGTYERIAAFLAAHALDKIADAENAQQFGDVRL